MHCVKSNIIANDNNAFPTKEITQIEIFDNQLKKHIDIRNEVSVIGSFPLMLMDYYGANQMYSIISGEKIVDNTLLS